MKSLVLGTILAIGAVTTTVAVDVMAAPNMTDYLIKGENAILALQDYNF